MPIFTIKDPDTGRTIQMTGAKPPAEADITAAFAKEPQSPQAQSSAFSDAANSVQSNPVMQTANFLSPGIGANINATANQMDYMANQPNTKGDLGASATNALDATGHLAEQLPGAAVGDALSIVGGKGIKNVVTNPVQAVKSVTNPIVTGAKLLTKKGAANITTNAAKAATDLGKTAKWNDIANEVRTAVQSQYGNSVEHMRAAEKLLAQEAPAKLGKNISKTPSELLDLRRQILARSGTGNIISKLMGMKNTEDQVAGVARNIISQHVHELAPESKMADKAYSLWSKAKGSPAEWIGRSLVGATAGKVGKVLGIPESATGDAVISLLSGTII